MAKGTMTTCDWLGTGKLANIDLLQLSLAKFIYKIRMVYNYDNNIHYCRIATLINLINADSHVGTLWEKDRRREDVEVPTLQHDL